MGLNNWAYGQTLDIGADKFIDLIGQDMRYAEPYRDISIHDGGRLRVDELDWLNDPFASPQPASITVTGTNSLLETRLFHSNDSNDNNNTLFLRFGTTGVKDGGRISAWQSFLYGTMIDVENGIFDSGFALSLAPDSTGKATLLTASNSVIAASNGRLSSDVELSSGSRMWLATSNIGGDFGRGEVTLSGNSTLGIGTTQGDLGFLNIGTSLKENSNIFQVTDSTSRLSANASSIHSRSTQIGLTERQSTLDESLSAFGQGEVVLSNNSYWSNSDGIDIENGGVTATNSTIETEILNVNADEQFSASFEMSGGSLVVAENPSGNYSGSSPGSLSVRGGKFHVTNDAIVDLQATFSVGETNLSNITAPIPNELSDIKISGGSKLKANSLNVEAGVGDSRITVTGADSAINVTATVFFDTDSFVFPTAGEIGVEVLDGASLTGESIFLAGGATFVQVAENGYLAAD